MNPIRLVGRAIAAVALLTPAAAFADAVPDPYAFVSPAVAVDPGVAVESDAPAISGIDEPATVTIESCGGESCAVSIAGGDFVPGPTTISNGQTVRVRLDPSAYATTQSLTLDIGGVDASFTVSTIAEPATILIFSSPGPNNPRINQSLVSTFTVQVLDSIGQPIQGALVTVTAPATGPSMTFLGSTTQTLTTDGGGLAQSASPVANDEFGNYDVVVASGLQQVTSSYINLARALSVSTPTIDFGPSQAGIDFAGLRQEVLTVTSVGNDPVGVFGGGVLPPFNVFNSNCFGPLPTGASCLLAVQYRADAVGPQSATLTLNSDADIPPPEILVQGEGVSLVNQVPDARPATSLLYPYFEVDVDDPAGVTTRLSVRSTSAAASLVHFTIWSDLGIPVLGFNVYLTGYDVANVDLGALIREGKLPITATDGQDPFDTGNPQDGISNQGFLSQDINFPNCGGELPYAAEALSAFTRAHVQAALTGAESPATALCYGSERSDRIARGYVTADYVNSCSRNDPPTPGYFPNEAVIRNNQLVGDYAILDPARGGAHVALATSLFTEPLGPLATAGNTTFYGALSDWNATDRREALPSTWAVDAAGAEAELIVWRDLRSPNRAPFSCVAEFPPGSDMPFGQESAITFDVTETPLLSNTSTAFPIVAQRVRLGDAGIRPVGKAGWTYLGLSSPSALGPPSDPAGQQAVVTVLQFGDGADGAGAGSAVALDREGDRRHVHPQD